LLEILASSKTKGAIIADIKKESVSLRSHNSTAKMDPNQVASVDDLDAPATYATPKKRLRRTTRQARKRLTDASMPSVVEAATPSMTNDSIQAGRNIRRRINQVVTPVGDDDDDASPAQEEVSNRQPKARRALRMDESQQVVPVTPSPQDLTSRARDNLRHHGSGHTPNAKRKLLFGRHVSQIHCPANVENIYNIVKKHTGSLGGNAIGGAIYGELTMGSMQKMVNLMKQHTNLSANSVFLDVGSGIGKPNLHVAQDPGVHTSIGIEMDADRYLLGMTCLKAVLDAATQQQEEHGQPSQPADLENSLSGTTARTVTSTETIGCKCFFIHENVLDANTLDPFTHVYMFSIGYVNKRVSDPFNLSDLLST
jgi:hypothetical protein